MRLSRSRLWALAAAAVLAGSSLVPLTATAEFAPDRGLWIALDLVIGFGFAGVGLLAWYRRPENRVGALMVATAFAWYVSVLERTEPPLLFSLGFALENLFMATAIHLLLAFPSGRLATATDRALVVVAYLTVTIGFVPVVLVADPEALGCANCPDNVFLAGADSSLANTWLDVLSVVGIVVLLAVLVRLVQRWWFASGPLRRTVTPVLVPGAALMTGLIVLLAIPFASASPTVGRTVFYSTMVPFALVPYLFLAGLLRGRMLRGRGLGALVRRLGAGVERGQLRAALAEALGDPSVDLAYWLPRSGRYVSAEGRALAPPGSDRAVTHVERDGRRIAAIVHDPTLLEDPEHVRAAGAAAALALENERLEAELHAKVDEVHASRSRLVEAGLRQRRGLERDLHDGAQQRLVSLALTLRLARAKLDAEPGATEQLLDRSLDELDQALKELRELARGIHPAVLSDRGLGPAVEALAQRAPLPVEVGVLPACRLPERIELAAYFVVSEVLTNVAKYAAASHATVAVAHDAHELTVEVSDDGVGGADAEQGTGLRGLADRLDAFEGSLDLDSAPGRGTTLRASIPIG